MSLSISTLKRLQEVGVPADRLMEIADLIEADFRKPPRSKGAERQARYRERQKGEHGDVTSDVTRDATSDEHVTIPLRPVESPLPLRPVDFDYGLSGASTRDERERVQVDLRNRTKDIFEAVRRRVNGSADFTRYQMQDMSAFIRLMAPLDGEPVKWVHDLGPAIETAAAQMHDKGKTLVTWNYVIPIALRNRDMRLAPLPKPEKPHERAGQSQYAASANGAGKNPSRSGHQHSGDALLDAVARRRDRRSAQELVPIGPEDGGTERVA